METEHGLLFVRRSGNWEWIGYPNGAELILHDGDDEVLGELQDLKELMFQYAPSPEIALRWVFDVIEAQQRTEAEAERRLWR